MFLLDQELLRHKNRADASGPSDRRTAKDSCILRVGPTSTRKASSLPTTLDRTTISVPIRQKDEQLL